MVFKDLSYQVLKSEYVSSCIHSNLLKKGIKIPLNCLNILREIYDEEYLITNVKFYLKLLLVYKEYSSFFESIGDPDLPLITQSDMESHTSSLLENIIFEFNNETYKCNLSIPNILGYNEPELDPDEIELNDLLRINDLSEDDFYSIHSCDNHFFRNIFLFSEDIDYAIENGHKETLINTLYDIIKLDDSYSLIRLKVITEESSLHMKNLHNRRSDILKSPLQNTNFKYNIILTLHEVEGEIAQNYYYHAYDFVDSIIKYIELSKFLSNIKKS